jgi:hypothetical protein
MVIKAVLSKGFVFWEIMGNKNQPLKHMDTKSQGSKLKSIIYTGNLQETVSIYTFVHIKKFPLLHILNPQAVSASYIRIASFIGSFFTLQCVCSVCQLDGKERKIQAQMCSDEVWFREHFCSEKPLICLLKKKVDSMMSATFVCVCMYVCTLSLFSLVGVTD